MNGASPNNGIEAWYLHLPGELLSGGTIKETRHKRDYVGWMVKKEALSPG